MLWVIFLKDLQKKFEISFKKFQKQFKKSKNLSKKSVKVEFDDEMVGYKLTGIREYGLFEFLGVKDIENAVSFIKTKL